MINPIGRYLVHSYIYYHLDGSIISDGKYDEMAKYILEHWNELEHPHKKLIDKSSLEAGTMLLREDEYPTIVKDTARMVKNGLIETEDSVTLPEEKKQLFSNLDEFFG